jgi:hypothetical protein
MSKAEKYSAREIIPSPSESSASKDKHVFVKPWQGKAMESKVAFVPSLLREEKNMVFPKKHKKVGSPNE